MNDIILKPNWVPDCENPSQIVEAWRFLQRLQARCKQLKQDIEAEIINYHDETGHNNFVLTDDEKLVISKQKKTGYETEKIYDLLSVPQEVRDVLPKNPAFRKTALKTILGEEDAAGVIKEILTDKIEIKKINQKYLK